MFTNQTISYSVVADSLGRRKYFARAAQDCGVSPSHLHRVVSGERKSNALMARVRRLHPELLKGLTK